MIKDQIKSNDNKFDEKYIWDYIPVVCQQLHTEEFNFYSEEDESLGWILFDTFKKFDWKCEFHVCENTNSNHWWYFYYGKGFIEMKSEQS